MIERFDNRNTLIEAMKQGINLFVGAGFSLYAKDADGRNLPTGKELLQELKANVGAGPSDLPMYCTIMEKKNKSVLHSYLTHRFRVEKFDSCYLNLNLINIKGVYTTNIDDLIPHIIEKSANRYINNQRVNGDCTDEHGVNYLPLHGNVDAPESGYVFSVAQLANIYNDTSRVWAYLTAAMEKYPTIFIGYGLRDTSVIQSITSNQTFKNAQKERWIVLYKPSEDEVIYYEAMGFSVIIADTKEFLTELPKLADWGSRKNAEHSSNAIRSLFGANIVPKDSRNLKQRPIEEFYCGMAPIWSDILRNVIFRTSHYKEIEDSVFSDKHTIIIGAPISGKSTLAMQVAHFINYKGEKLIFNDINEGRAAYIKKIVGSQHVLLIIENFTDDIEAFISLGELPNVKLLGIDRSHNFTIVSHLLPLDEYKVINVTELQDYDISGILDSVPVSVRKEDLLRKQKGETNDSIYEFIIRHIKGQNIQTRYKNFIISLEQEDPDLAEFLVLCAYMHVSRVPLSMEVAYRYFDEYSYKDVIEIRKQLSDFLAEDDAQELAINNVDGYRPRSSIVADTIISSVSVPLLAKVISNVVEKVPYFMICNYRTFKKWAFDKNLILKAFPNWRDGKDFYEKAFIYDNRNPFVLQQGALYLSAKHRYDEAFDWIDRAKVMTHDTMFSIRNSHAIILFEANYEFSGEDVMSQLDRSMEILHKCYDDDMRRTFHAKTYADQAIRYYRKYNTEKAKRYLSQALEWLNQEIIDKPWAYDMKKMILQIKETLEN